MPGIGFLGEALIALGAGVAGGVARRQAADEFQQQKLAGDAVMQLLSNGQDVPDALGKVAFGGKYKEIGPQLKVLTASQRQRQQQQMQDSLQMVQNLIGGGAGAPAPEMGPTGAVGPMAGTAPQAAAPGVSALLSPQVGPAAMGPGTTFQPPAGGGEAPMPSVPVPQLRPSVSATIPFGKPPTVTVTAPSSAEQARLGFSAAEEARKRALFPGQLGQQRVDLEREQAKMAREKLVQQREDAGRAQIQTLMEQSAAAQDPDTKRGFFERAAAIAAGAGLKDVETLLKAHTAPPKPEKLDLSKPGVAETVAATGLDPVTRAPVDDATHKAAISTMRAREQRQVNIAGAVQKARDADIPQKIAITGTMRGLVKESDTVSNFTQKTAQIEGALNLMEKNLSVYPTSVLGRPSAQFSKLIQDDRGRVIAQIEQAVNVLQSAEARFMANEVGRIPYQLEKQWREVLADPTKVTRATAQSLIQSTRARLRDMAAGKERAVKARAGVATRLGVPKPITDAFVQGDTEALKLSLSEGTSSGALPPILDDADFR